MATIYLSLGSNLGDKRQNIMCAIAEIGSSIGRVRKVSEFYESEPVGFVSENSFFNVALLIESNLTPTKLLEKTQQLELLLGRVKKTTTHYADRIIDIDILLYDDEHINLPELKIPHPLMLERDFVLIPLREIAPELPIFNVSK